MKFEGENPVRKLQKLVVKVGIIGLLIQGTVSVSLAGSFIGSLGSSSSLNNQDFIMHPTGYAGSGASLTVNLCIVPGTTNAASMVVPVANIAARMTAQAGKTGNLSTGDGGDTVPISSWDFESVALHEVGHCLGLGHVNAATESGFSGDDQDYTKAAVGADAVLNAGAGSDTITGSRDDVRGDDVSVHWFRQGSNDPCADPGTITFDSTTYSVDGALPSGHDFAANADKTVCNALGSSNTEAIMQQGSPSGQAQRFLGHDDEAMLRLAMSGVDESQGTADDYSLSVNSLGISDSADCDINLSFNDAETGFAICHISYFTSTNGNADHGRIVTANAYFNTTAVTWFFNSSSGDTNSYAVGGTVSGLTTTGLVLQNNLGDDLEINSIGVFEFTTPLANGSTYAVTVKTQPPDMSQVCVVSNGSGTLAGADVTNVSVFCTEPCNARVVSGVTEDSPVTHEACEVLVVGPGFVAEDTAEVILSSGWVIEMVPGFQVDQGAILSANVCGQSLCEESATPMPLQCHSCVFDICTVDAYCCTTEFDDQCVEEVFSICGLVCE